MKINQFKEKYCRKNANTDMYEERWFIKNGDCVKYEHLEADVKSVIQDEKRKTDLQIERVIIKDGKVVAIDVYDWDNKEAIYLEAKSRH